MLTSLSGLTVALAALAYVLAFRAAQRGYTVTIEHVPRADPATCSHTDRRPLFFTSPPEYPTVDSGLRICVRCGEIAAVVNR